ncbi:Disheveled-associated activator of morphogenesis 1 [Orchesella cincta]|uniref:Disheveled-associated activator of morphogenesis 1 n=1 Tax=Orchesella cincta TaxID=48709 RepID=A0A1D2MLQ8_ORCCI|nr:Disheveled-associated activator of morphogenesis 1 [Orchesella cincta]
MLEEELDLSLPNKTAMLSLPIEKKWQIYCSRKHESENSSLVSFSPEYYIDRVNNLMVRLQPLVTKPPKPPPVDDASPPVKLYESLRTALRTQPNSFVHRFLELQGLQTLLNILQNESRSQSHPLVITCVKSLMNNTTGRAHVLAHRNSIKCKIDVLEILGAVCLVPRGHRKVLHAIDHLQEFAGERARFQTIINDLDRSTGPYKQDVSLKTAIMSFLNAVLSYGPGQKNLEFRVHLRYELLIIGIEPVISKLRGFENETLDKHIEFFEIVRVEDEKELARRWGETHVNTKNVDDMFELIKMRLSHSYAYVNLQSILSHLLMLPRKRPPTAPLGADRQVDPANSGTAAAERGGRGVRPRPRDRVQHQSQRDCQEVRNTPFHSFNHTRSVATYTNIICRLEEEERISATLEKIECLTRENNLIRSNLTSKEQDLELKMQQIEDLENTITRLRERLEKESLMRLEESQRVAELQLKVQKIGETQQIIMQPAPMPQAHCKELSKQPPHPLRNTSHLRVQALLQCHLHLRSEQHPTPTTSPKPIPSASAPLKSFNWSKLPETKLNGTVWSELDESVVYSTLDLKEIDRLFSAYQKNTEVQATESVTDSLKKPPPVQSKRLISVIDGRRAQNCTILLSKLKMSDEEICNAILSMDVSDNLPLDMIEQLLKFTPSTEEVALLEEQNEDVMLARADSFLLKISKITHYEERLRVLQYKKRFVHIVEETNGRMKTVVEACREVTRSRKLRKMLEVILALGNYMNRGSRGNASGFRLPSLTRISDTKSNQRNQNLMNYLAVQVESHWNELSDLETELSHVRGAAKVSLNELEKDMGYLRSGLECVNREVEFQRGLQKMDPGDRFLPSVREFLSSAVCRIQELEDLERELQQNSQAVREEYKEIDEFFSIFDQFLNAYGDARAENESLRKKREDEEKRAMDATLRRCHGGSESRKMVLDRSVSLGGNAEKEPGEFDDLISALRTGDVFTEDVTKYKRRHATRTHHRVNSTRDRDLNNSRERIH